MPGDAALAVWSDTRSNPYGTSDYETVRYLYAVRLDAAVRVTPTGQVRDANPIPLAGLIPSGGSY